MWWKFEIKSVLATVPTARIIIRNWQGLTPNAVQSRHRCRWSCCVLSLLSPVLLLSGWIVYPPGLRCTLSETRQLAHRGYAPPVVLYCIIYTSYYQTMPHMVPAAIPSCFKSGKPATSQPVNQLTCQPVNLSTSQSVNQSTCRPMKIWFLLA